MLVPAVYGLWRLWELLVTRRRADAAAGREAPDGFGAADLPWVVPGAVFVVWQLVLWGVTGAMPAGQSGGSHVVAPLVDLLPAVIDWLTPSGTSQVLWLVEVLVFVALATLVAVSNRSAGWERGVAVVGVLFVAVLNDNVFIDPAHFRQLGEVSVVLCLAAFRADPRWWIPILGANAGRDRRRARPTRRRPLNQGAHQPGAREPVPHQPGAQMPARTGTIAPRNQQADQPGAQMPARTGTIAPRTSRRLDRVHRCRSGPARSHPEPRPWGETRAAGQPMTVAPRR